MAGQTLGASSPSSLPSSSSLVRPTLHVLPGKGTRSKRNHGAFSLGGHLGCIYSERRAGVCYGVRLEVGAGTLQLAADMTATQARGLARALLAAAAAVDGVQADLRKGGAA